jgi:dihydrofolate synthase/folylpolyglutamate synthase
MDHPERTGRYVHVAGTNGKGSVCAMIERALRSAGRRTGLYTSPHLVEPTERVRVDGEPVSHERFAAAFDLVHATAERLIAAGAIDMHPTYFETVTAMAFHLFREARVEIVVLETGLGGRLDATNVVDPELSVITPIDLDHQRFLGNTIPQIAYEKSGILKPGRPAVFSAQHPEALEVLEEQARKVGAPVVDASRWYARDVHVGALGNRFTAVRDETEIQITSPLIGEHQIGNALTAIAALRELRLSKAAIARGLNATRWPGRLELVRRAPDIFYDGAHNPAGAATLAGYIRRFCAGRRVWMIYGAMKDKDIVSIAALLFPLADELIFTTVSQARAYSGAELREISGAARARVVDKPQDALELARRAPAGDVVFVTGSLYLVGELYALPARVG